MALNDECFVQKCLYWQVLPGLNMEGEEQYAVPRQIDCFWQDKVSQVITADNTEQVSTSRAYVKEILLSGGFLQLDGDENTADPDPRCQEGARRILTFRFTPDVDGEENEFCAYVQ